MKRQGDRSIHSWRPARAGFATPQAATEQRPSSSCTASAAISTIGSSISMRSPRRREFMRSTCRAMANRARRLPTRRSKVWRALCWRSSKAWCRTRASRGPFHGRPGQLAGGASRARAREFVDIDRVGRPRRRDQRRLCHGLHRRGFKARTETCSRAALRRPGARQSANGGRSSEI